MFITLWILVGIFVGLPVTLLSMVCPPLAGIVTFCWIGWGIILIAAISNLLDSTSKPLYKLTPEEVALKAKRIELSNARKNLQKTREEAFRVYINNLSEREIENSVYGNHCEIKGYVYEATGVVLNSSCSWDLEDGFFNWQSLWSHHPRVIQIRTRIEKAKRIAELNKVNKEIEVLNGQIKRGELI